MALAAARNRFAFEQTRPTDAPIQHQLHQLHHQSDAKRNAYLDDDDTTAILDANILDADIMQSPANHDISFRKDSFAQHSGVLSPNDAQSWDQQYPSGLPIDPSMNGFSSTFSNEPNGYGRHHSISHPPSHQHQSHGGVWGLASDSGHCTPAGALDTLQQPSNYDNAPYVHQRADSAHANFSHPPPPAPFNAPTTDAGFIPAP